MARDHAGTTVARVTQLEIQSYFDKFTGHAQRARRAEFKRFFNHLIARNPCPKLTGNPFSTDDSKPQVAMRARPGKRRMRLNLDDFWAIYHHAGNSGESFLQVAMGLSLITTLRRGDICELRLDKHVDGNLLRKQINKSHAQLSQAEFKADPSNLSWNLKDHTMLRQLVNKARELSLQHARCPFLVSFKPKRRIKGDARIHSHQVLPDYLTRAFADTRDASGAFDGISPRARPSFHEIRALASHLLNEAGHDTKDVQVLMAHTDEKITKHYQQGHAMQWTEIDLNIPAELIKGEF